MVCGCGLRTVILLSLLEVCTTVGPILTILTWLLLLAVVYCCSFCHFQSVISYVHRIGRTGRAGRPGEAITFFTEDDMVRHICLLCVCSCVCLYVYSLIRVRCHFGGLNRLVLLPPELILLPLFALPLFPPSLLCLQLFLRSIANVMRVSGCDVPEWMLKIKKLR